MASPYRDRTAEFRSLSQTLKKIGGITAVNQPENSPSPSKPSPTASSRSEFNKKASRIGLGIHETSQKISRLAQCIHTHTYISSYPFAYMYINMYICFLIGNMFNSVALLRKCWNIYMYTRLRIEYLLQDSASF